MGTGLFGRSFLSSKTGQSTDIQVVQRKQDAMDKNSISPRYSVTRSWLGK